MPSSSLVSSGCEGSLGPMMPSDNYGDQPVLDNYGDQQVPDNYDDQQVRPEATRIQRKERTVYSHEQKLLLQKYFDQNMYPSLEQRVELAEMINVTEYEIQNWFKNHRAKHKRKNLQKIVKGMLESSGSIKDVSESTHSHRHLSVLASDNGESKSPGTSTVASVPKLNPSLKASLHDDQAAEDAGCSPQEDSLEAAAPVAGQSTVVEDKSDQAMTEGPASVETPVSTTAEAPDLGILELAEVQTDPSVAEELDLVQAPIPTTAAVRGPDDAQYVHTSSEQLWQWIHEDMDTWEDS
ncbi:hypothetical protein STEG23_006749 [Scotinomys teguina]